MKNIITLLLAVVMCLSLCACGSSKELEKYEKYETLINYLEANDYASAIAEITRMQISGGTNDCTEGNDNNNQKVIEITLDNWQEYFEIALVANIERNDFNEIVEFTPGWIFRLKEQYAEAAEAVDVAVEYSCTNGYFCTYTYNLDTEEISIGEPDINNPANDSTETFTISHPSGYGGITSWTRSGSNNIEGNIATSFSSKYVNIDILRVQGSITITE